LTQRTEDYYLNGFYHQAGAFFDALQSGVQPEHDFRSARQPVEIMAGIMNRNVNEKERLDIAKPIDILILYSDLVRMA
jgi:hypothetical protein